VVARLPVKVGLALTSVVLNVATVAVWVVLALEPVDTLAAVWTPKVIDVAVAAADVTVGAVAVRLVAAVQRAEAKVTVPHEMAMAVTGLYISVRSIAVGVQRTVENAQQYFIVPGVGGLAEARGSINVLTGAMWVVSAVNVFLALQLSSVPAVVFVAEARVYIQIDIRAIAVGVLTAIEVAVMILPYVLGYALAGAGVSILVGAPANIRTVEVA